jgi:hypothetical protein
MKKYNCVFSLSFKMTFILCISHRYIFTIASKLDIEQLQRRSPRGSCSSSPSNFSPTGHIITGDVNIVQIENDLGYLILKGPKFGDPSSVKWHHTVMYLMDCMEEYSIPWTKSEGEKLDTLSEWIKSIFKLLKSHIHHLSGKMPTIYLLFLRNQKWYMNYVDCVKTVCCFQQIKQVIALSSFVNISIMNVFKIN